MYKTILNDIFILSFSLNIGDNFDVEFIFRGDSVYVYTDAGAQYTFEFRSQWQDIKAVQIWDDLEYIESVEFKYKIPIKY